jgi:hypothetical protein
MWRAVSATRTGDAPRAQMAGRAGHALVLELWIEIGIVREHRLQFRGIPEARDAVLLLPVERDMAVLAYLR